MDLKVTSIQELENIDVTKYGDNPESLVQLAKQLQNYQKYEKAIEVLEQALKFSIKNNGDNEEALDCAKFYHNYGVSILRKIMENNNELFQNTVEETKKSKSENKKKENEVNETNSIENKTSSPAKKAAEHLTKSNTKTGKIVLDNYL